MIAFGREVIGGREECERRYETTVRGVGVQEDVRARHVRGDEVLRGPKEFARFLEDDAVRPEQCGACVALWCARFSVGESVDGKSALQSRRGFDDD